MHLLLYASVCFMVWRGRILAEVKHLLQFRLGTDFNCPVVSKSNSRYFSASKALAVESCPVSDNGSSYQEREFSDLGRKDDIDALIDKVIVANNEGEVFQSLVHNFGSETIQISDSLVERLLHRFQDDWKSALGVFRWVESCPSYKPPPEFYDKLVDILGKAKEMEKMKGFLEEMRGDHVVSLNTIAKAMRRYAGAGDWKDAVKMFDELGHFGLQKNTESMNLLLDTLCKSQKVEQARAVFLELKSHIPPNANTYNIFIHGWCKVKKVDEAQWTIQEMMGNGFLPCVISYSTIIQFYCNHGNFDRINEVLDKMEAHGCPPNVVTFTTIMHSLTKAGRYREALKLLERMKLLNCEPDTLFYNALIHTLGRAGRVEEAVYVFEEEMPRYKVNPNTSTYNTMVAMFCHQRQEQRALQYLRYLENSQYCKPDVQSFYPLLKSYFRQGKTDGGLAILLDDMVKKHHLSLDLATFTLLIHGLCRSKKCEWAYQLFKEMVFRNIQPRYNTCSLLLQEIKQTHMYDAAEMIEDFMKKMKSS